MSFVTRFATDLAIVLIVALPLQFTVAHLLNRQNVRGWAALLAGTLFSSVVYVLLEILRETFWPALSSTIPLLAALGCSYGAMPAYWSGRRR